MFILRGKDNFNNDPCSYIIQQLFIYDYNNPIHRDILKFKIWSLDGVIAHQDTATVLDNSYQVPKNHYHMLKNELCFLDLYIRTKEHQLLPNEQPFEKFKANRIAGFNSWITSRNYITGVLNKDYELPYLSRPSYLSDSQFQTLYSHFQTKRSNNELSSALEILDSITLYDIDQEILQAEQDLENYQSPSVIKASILRNAQAMKNDKDDLFVIEHNKYLSELRTIFQTYLTPDYHSYLQSGENLQAGALRKVRDINSGEDILYIARTNITSTSNYTTGDINEPWVRVTYPDWEPHHSYVDGDYFRHNHILYKTNITFTSTSSFSLNTVSRVEECFGFLNFPQDRVEVLMSPGSSSHKGRMEIEGMAGAGYRFQTLNLGFIEGSLLPPPNNTGVVNNLVYSNQVNQPEWFSKELQFCILGVDSIINTRSSVISTSLHSESLPSGSSLPGSITRDRVKELIKRWDNFNTQRENQYFKSGLRVIIESMINATVPDTLSDLQRALRIKIEQKQLTYNILSERLSEYF